MANRQRANNMADRGATAKEIRQATGVTAQAARNIVSRAAASAPAPASSGPYNATNMPITSAAPTAGPLASGYVPLPSSPAAAPAAPKTSVQQVSKQNSLTQNLRAAQSGGVTRQEFADIYAFNGKDDGKVIRRMDAMNKNGRDLRLNSGTANMLIKRANKQPSAGMGLTINPYGTGNIGRALAGMIGDPGTPGAMIKGQRVGGREATPGTGMMIGGTQIRKGGRVAVRGFGAGNTQNPNPDANPNPDSNPNPDPATEADPILPPELPPEELPEEPKEPGPGMMAGGGLGALGANKLNRAKSRLRQLGIYGRGTGLLGRGLQYGNALNA
jgi:hypothetical protein